MLKKKTCIAATNITAMVVTFDRHLHSHVSRNRPLPVSVPPFFAALIIWDPWMLNCGTARIYSWYIYINIYIYILNWDPHPQNGSALVFDVLIYPQVVVRLWCGHKKHVGKSYKPKAPKRSLEVHHCILWGPLHSLKKNSTLMLKHIRKTKKKTV